MENVEEEKIVYHLIPLPLRILNTGRNIRNCFLFFPFFSVLVYFLYSLFEGAGFRNQDSQIMRIRVSLSRYETQDFFIYQLLNSVRIFR
jgi:hypothetical protein